MKRFLAVFMMVAFSSPAWAACETERKAMEMAQREMRAALSTINLDKQREARDEEARPTFDDRQYSTMVSGPQAFMNTPERRDSWKEWRKTQTALDACTTAESARKTVLRSG